MGKVSKVKKQYRYPKKRVSLLNRLLLVIWDKSHTEEFKQNHKRLYMCVCGHYKGEHSGRDEPGYSMNEGLSCHYCPCPIFKSLGENEKEKEDAL